MRGQGEVQAQLLKSSKSAYAEFVSEPETLRPKGFNELGDCTRAACDRYNQEEASISKVAGSCVVQGFRQPTSNPWTSQTQEIISFKIVAFYLVMCLASGF
jgi:hypothetical protein